jgi:endoglucanase
MKFIRDCIIAGGPCALTGVKLCVVATGLSACSAGPASSSEATQTVGSAESAAGLARSTRFFTPLPGFGAFIQDTQLQAAQAAADQQVLGLIESGDLKDAALLADVLAQPEAVWFTGGTPAQVEQMASLTVKTSKLQRSVPVLVAYNVPFRDCAQYSAGGATDTAAYEAWIDAFAAGIGQAKAVVVLEPDSLGIIPYNTTIYGSAEWCQPDLTGTGLTPAEANAARYVQINYAVHSLATHAPNALVYLDGTHSAWLGVGEAAYRLYTAGVQQARGFYVNVSNYQPTDQSTQFATWVSDCLTASIVNSAGALGAFQSCPSQYDPALNYAIDYSAAYEAKVTAQLETMPAGATPTTSFIIDTSRNGQGTLNTTVYAQPPYNQPASVISSLNGDNWCNPPGAGVGLRPTANTSVPLLDAYLWVKTVGESDGQCDIAGGARAWDYADYNPWGLTGDAQNTFDPLWGQVDPAAGVWFSAQALQLAQRASPALF